MIAFQKTATHGGLKHAQALVKGKFGLIMMIIMMIIMRIMVMIIINMIIMIMMIIIMVVIMIILMMVIILILMTMIMMVKICASRYECMDFGACVDVSTEEDPMAICECQVLFIRLNQN